MKVLVCDPIAPEAIEDLKKGAGVEVKVCAASPGEEELVGLVADADALIVRSATRITATVMSAAPRLKVVGRAGAGVDNVDLQEATRRGIVVLNAPEGNSIAAAEHTFSMLLALARHIPQANRSMLEGQWQRKKFTGVEVAGKTLGVLGLGRVGREVARRALAFRMRVLAYDPFVPSQVAKDLGAEPCDLDRVIAESDFLTMHLPLTGETTRLLNADVFARMKRGVRIVNCARGGLVDEEALQKAIESGQVAGAALDVFSEEPPSNRALISMSQVISTPHLGASTVEAQRRVGEQIVAKIRGFLETGLPLDAVNFPSVPPQHAARLLPFIQLVEKMGAFVSQIGPPGVRRVELRYSGELQDLDVRPLTMAAVKGILSPVLEHPVGYVNALSVAGERGLTVEEIVSRDAVAYSSLVEIRACGEGDEVASCAGTVFGPGESRIVSVNGIRIEANPSGICLFFRNDDVPGVIGTIGSVLGAAGVNIGAMALGRQTTSGKAVAIVNVDSPVPQTVVEIIRRRPEFDFVRQVTL